MQAQFPPRVGIKPPGWPGISVHIRPARGPKSSGKTIRPSVLQKSTSPWKHTTSFPTSRPQELCHLLCFLWPHLHSLLPMGESPGFSFSYRASYQSRLSSSSHLALEDRLLLAPLVPLSPWEGSKGEVGCAFRVLVGLTRLSRSPTSLPFPKGRK